MIPFITADAIPTGLCFTGTSNTGQKTFSEDIVVVPASQVYTQISTNS
jgi:hypothetical protein